MTLYRQVIISLGAAMIAAQPAFAQVNSCDGAVDGGVTNVYFANGVDNDLADAVATRDLLSLSKRVELEALRDSDPSCIDEKFIFFHAYNDTQGLLTDIIQVLQQKAAEYGVDDEGLTGYEIYSWIINGLSFEEVQASIEGNDALGPAASFITQEILDSLSLDLLNAQVEAMADARDVLANHVAAYDRDLREGKRVIVIAHSQGNLFTDVAVRQVRGANPDAADSIGVLGVATPAAPPGDGSYYVTAHDDRVIDFLRLLVTNVLDSNIDNDLGSIDKRSFLNHGFLLDYFEGSLPSRIGNSTKPGIDDELQRLALEMPYPTPPPDTSPPTVPQNVEAVATGVDQISISWSPSTDDSGFVASYEVYRGNDRVATVTETTAIDSGLAAGTEYCYTVLAVDLSGNPSEPSSAVCAVTYKADATEGWLVFESGDPGIPGDNVIVDGVECGDPNCPYREFTPTEAIRLGPDGTPITLSVFEARFGFFIRFRLAGYPEYCSSSYADSLNNGDTPTYNDIPGRFLVIDETIFNDGVERARTSFADCEAAPASAGYISRIDSSTGGLGLDAAYLAYGADVFPDDGLQPVPDSENWVSFEEGDPGVPDDGILVAGQSPCQGCPPQHTIVEQIVVGDADGLTLSIYGSEAEAIDNVVLRFQGFPEVCNFEIPIGGVLPSAPLISGKPGKYLSLQRSTLATQAQVVAILNAASCGDVTESDVYYSAFELSGTVDLVDGAYVGVGQNAFPSDQ